MAKILQRRLAVVLSHPVQYYSPWFRWLRQHTAIKFRVFYLWDFGVTRRRDHKFQASFQWDVDLLSGYDSEFVPNLAGDPGTHHIRGLNNPSLTSHLASWAPDAVLLFGYKWVSHLRVIAWARRRRVPLLFRGDSHLLGRGRLPAASRWMLRTLYSQFAGFLAVGAANRDYFLSLGVPQRKIHFAPHAVDDAHFDPSRASDQQAAAELRRSLGLAPQTKVVLFAGKFMAEKAPQQLLTAFRAANVPDTALVYVGEGEEKPAVMAAAKAAPAGTVHFLPFANQSEMPARYLMADLFVLPSSGVYETWGLAVNEAMHMGVPALVSNRVGCQRDLVLPGETGWVFRAGDTDDFRGQLIAALNTLKDRNATAELRQRVRERVGRYTYGPASAGLQAALTDVMPQG
jgi:glycosyltransferase involved in cell wall biosynthesis